MSRFMTLLPSRFLWNMTAASSISLLSYYGTERSTGCEGRRNSKERQVFTWGSGALGQLGQGNNKDLPVPTTVTNFPEHFHPKMVAAGADSTAVVSTSGEVYTFGAGGHSRLGHGDAYDLPNISVPQMIYSLQDKKIISVSVGEYHMAAVSEDGRLWTWGRDGAPQLGHNNKLCGHPNEVVELSGKVKEVQCGRQHTVALTKDGKVYTWGIGRQGALGHCNREDVHRPRLVEKLDKKNIVAISCGREFTLALDSNGVLYCWGANDYGQLGLVTVSRYQYEPLANHAFPEDSKLIAVSAGSFHSVALTESGKVYTWGKGKDGQLGLGNNEDLPSPRKVQALDHVKIQSISSGDGHTSCIDEKGEMWLFGRGRSGQLGRGNQLESIAAYRNLPTHVTLPKGYAVKQTSCGYDHTIALGSLE